MIITDNDFDKTIKENGLVLVDFWAEWCNPCKRVAPILDEISQEYGLLVAKINVDENPIKSKKYGVVSIPTFVLFENGIPMKTIVGAKPKHVMLKELEEWL